MSDADREQRYAEAIALALGFTHPLRPHKIAARAAIEVANGEQQACASDNDRLIAETERLKQGLWDTWAALGHDTDGDSGPGALVAGMGVEWFISMVIEDATKWRRESEEDYDADTTRLELERDGWKHRAETAEAALEAAEWGDAL